MSSENFEKAYPPGIKWTKQRKDVYHILLQASKPLSVQEIYNDILQRNENVSYAVSTIYRILTAFEEKNMVLKSTLMGEDIALYEWNKGEHLHYAICLGCHKKIALHHCPLEHLHAPVDSDEFTVTGHRVEVYGYCKDCGNQENS